jgi:hypothetical protein
VRPRSLLSHVHAQVVEIFGREMFLYDCDNFTREYYALQLNMEQPANQVRALPGVGFNGEMKRAFTGREGAVKGAPL